MSHRGRERSRSPRRRRDSNEDYGGDASGKHKSLKISKRIAAIGRYADRRPPGLVVLEDGALSARNLAGVLREDENDIVTAVVTNRWNDSSNSDRFLVRSGADGDLYINVASKRPDDSGKGPGERRKRGPRVSHPFAGVDASDCEMIEEADQKTERLQKAMEQSLDEVISGSRKPKGKGKGKGGRHSGNRRSGEVSNGKENEAPSDDKTIAWISWVLKFGFLEKGVPVASGWARIGNLAEAMCTETERHPEWTGMTEEKLVAHIERINTAGALEIDDKWLRFVEPQNRKPKDPRPPEQSVARDTLEMEPHSASGAEVTEHPYSTGGAEVTQELSEASTAMPAADADVVADLAVSDDEGVDWDSDANEQDEALAAQCSKALNVCDMDADI